MTFKNDADYSHRSSSKVGILLTNLGTPDSCKPSDVRRYLKEFLWDPRVVEVPRPIWWFVLNLVILNTRPRRSARAYAKVWTERGSPLLDISLRQQAALQAALDELYPDVFHVELAMRYGNPSIANGLENLRRAGADRVLVLRLYPQYSASTTASTFDAVTSELQQWRRLPELRFINHYHDHEQYIQALADSIRSFQEDNGKPEKLIMSFHGVPMDYLLNGDPYHCECHKTARLLAEKLGLKDNEYMVTFQSRLGPKEWLKPYTDHSLETLGKAGIKSVQVVCPGFSSDCLETLEEIAMENRDVFLEAGGQDYAYIPCLNDSQPHVQLMQELVEEHTSNWPKLSTEEQAHALALRQQRAQAMGAEK
jgi:ferrochelatase